MLAAVADEDGHGARAHDERHERDLGVPRALEIGEELGVEPVGGGPGDHVVRLLAGGRR